jgi:antitoxin MazE
MSNSHTVLIARWGDSLAIRLPFDLVMALKLQVGDEIEFIVEGCRSVPVRQKSDVDDLLERLRHFRGKLPANFQFSRDESRT